MVEQNSLVVKTEQKRGWFPVNSRPRLVSGGRKSINLLDAVTDDRDRFILLVPGRLTAELAKHFLWAFQQKFGRNLELLLDNATYS